MVVTPFLNNQFFYLKVRVALLLLVLVCKCPSFFFFFSSFCKSTYRFPNTYTANFHMHRLVHPVLLFGLVFVVAAFVVFPGTSLLEPSVLLLQSEPGLIRSAQPRMSLSCPVFPSPQFWSGCSESQIPHLPVFHFTPLFPWRTSCSNPEKAYVRSKNGSLHI